MRKQISYLLQKYSDGLLTSEELEQLHLLVKDPEQRESINAYYTDKWEKADPSPSNASLKHQKHIWRQIRHRIGLHEKNTNRSYSSSWQLWVKIASIIILPLLILLGGLYWGINLKDHSDEKLYVYVEPGQKANLVLPDGSKVFLNSASHLSYDHSFNKKDRNIYLSGEAFFEVQKDDRKPFVVKTANGTEVKALGTQFDVKAYPNDTYLKSTLIEGSILVSQDGQSLLLNPYETISINNDNGKWEKSVIGSKEEVLSWMNNTLYFRQQTLGEIAKVLERTYAVTFIFENEEIKGLRYSGSIKNNSLQNILSLIVSVSPTPIEYKIEDSKVVLTQK